MKPKSKPTRAFRLTEDTIKKLSGFLIIVALMLSGYLLGTNRAAIVTFLTSPQQILFGASADTISAKQLANMLKKKNFTLINVHTPYEGEIGKTDTFIPYDKIVENSGSLPKDKNAPIILYCHTGRMSGEAIVILKKLGYTNVKHLAGGMVAWTKAGNTTMDLSNVGEEVVPKDGATLPIVWGDIGPKLVQAGVIDLSKFKQAVKLTPDQEKILTQGSDEKIKIDATNSQFIVDILWAIGLAQKSIVYEQGPMGKDYKKDVGNFASTGGWNLARGDALQYLNRFDFIKLTDEQQKKVGEIAQNVYRPCCGNSTWFPDCNHGMAALAAIEMMIAAGVDEQAIYKNVLALNSFWFADTYLTIATHFARYGTPWKDIDAKLALSQQYSSAQGAMEISKKVGPLPYRPAPSGGGCGA